MPADNGLHRDQHAETSRRSGMLSDITSDEEMLYWLLSSWRRKETPQDDTISCVNIDAFYTTKPFQANYFFSCDSILFSLRIIIQNGIYSIREMSGRGKCSFSLASVLTQESKSSPIWSITEDSFLFRTAAICSSIETEIQRKGPSGM